MKIALWALGGVWLVGGAPPPAKWSLELIATLTPSADVGFTRVRSVLLDAKGEAWVIDAGDKSILHFAADGKRLGRLGRVGAGPMEYRDPYSLAWLNGDLLLYDPGNARAVHWTRDGKWVEQWPTKQLTGGSPVRFYPTSAGAWLMQYGRGPDGKGTTTYERFPPTGRGDTLIAPSRASGNTGVVTCQGTDKGLHFFSSPFTPAYQVAPLGATQFVTLEAEKYQLVFRGANGDTVRIIEHATPRAPIGDAEWQAGTEDYPAYKKADPKADCRGELKRPSAKPAARDLALDDAGRIWVETIGAGGFGWDVWENGALVATLVSPAREEEIPVEIRGDRMAMTVELADGGHAVRVYRIRRLAAR